MLQFLASPTLLEIVNIWASNNICNLSGIGECACESVCVKVCTTGGWETMKGQWISNWVFKKKNKDVLRVSNVFLFGFSITFAANCSAFCNWWNHYDQETGVYIFDPSSSCCHVFFFVLFLIILIIQTGYQFILKILLI